MNLLSGTSTGNSTGRKQPYINSTTKYVTDHEPRGSFMPHLVGDGGSRDENLFNGTNFPNQWLSLTRHQLDKFQHWVNGSFVSQAPETVSGYMSVPWHGDFWSCSRDFWAAQRSDIVVSAKSGPVGSYEFSTKD